MSSLSTAIQRHNYEYGRGGAPKGFMAMKRVWIGGAVLFVLLGIVAAVAIPKMLHLRARLGCVWRSTKINQEVSPRLSSS